MAYGARHSGRLALAGAWVVVTASDVITFLINQQPSIWEIPRPWPLAALGWVYPALGLVTLAATPALLRTGQRSGVAL